MTDRGVIIAPPYTLIPGGFRTVGGMSPASLRYYLMFWDKIDCPDNNFISTSPGLDADLGFLQQEGIYDRTMIQFSGNYSSASDDIFAISQWALLKMKNSSDRESWCVAQAAEQLVLPSQFQGRNGSLEFNLHNLIPVPNPEVPLQDILEFKEKRRDELIQFRSVMDGFYLEIVNSSDPDRSIIYIERKIKIALQNLACCTKESGLKTFFPNVSLNINFPSAAIVYGALTALHVPVELAVGISGMVSLGWNRNLRQPDAALNASDFTYIESIYRHFG